MSPPGIAKPLLKAPAAPYAANAGWLLGHRFLLLVHRGRKSGRVYRTVLEVVAWDAASSEAPTASCSTGWSRARLVWWKALYNQERREHNEAIKKARRR